MSKTSIDLSNVTETLRSAIESGAEQEELIRRMRAFGLNQIECIKVFRDLMGVSLGDAKVAVHYSQAWSDCRESNDALHEAAFTAAKELGYLAESTR